MSNPATSLATSEPKQSLAVTGQNWPELMKFADFVCKADLMPPHLKNKPADCLLVAMQAQRWQMDFFAVAQCTSIVRGKPMYEGKLVAAAINASGALQGSLNHSFAGEYRQNGSDLACTITGKLKGEETPRTWEVKWMEGFAHAQDKAQWTASPKKRLLYFATREWARVHMPEVMLGVRADDETFPDGSSAEHQQVSYQPITQHPTRTLEANAEVVTGEIQPVCWSDLLLDNAWRNIAVPADLKLTSTTVGLLQRNREEAEQADKAAKDGSHLRWALDCMRWIGIERTLASLQLTTEQFQDQCREIGLLKSDQTVFDTDSAQLRQLAVGAHNIMKARKAEEDRREARQDTASAMKDADVEAGRA